MSDSRSSRAFFRGARGVRADSSIRIGIAKSVLDEGCSTTRNGREKRLFIGGIRARSEARRVRGECRPSLKAGQRDMSQCVLTSLVGRRWWDSRWSDRPAEGRYRTREGGADARASTPLYPRHLSRTLETTSLFADKTDSPHRSAAMIIFPFRASIANEILFEIKVKNNDIFFFFLKIKITLIYLKLKQDGYYEVIYIGLYVDYTFKCWYLKV